MAGFSKNGIDLLLSAAIVIALFLAPLVLEDMNPVAKLKTLVKTRALIIWENLN